MDKQPKFSARDIVVIGGSQGALDVLRSMLGSLPRDFPAAILIVIHSGTSSPGHLATILGRYSTLPVEYACEDDQIEHGRAYLAPADRHLEIIPPGLLHLDDGPKVRNARPAVDRLFMTAAEVYGPRVVCLILSGGDSDGVDGANAVSAADGICLVQEPQEAVIPSMPISVILKDHPDAVVRKDDMTSALLRAVNGTSA
ncbi:chemotaxis protein CheB [Pseudomonas sp. v388]|uniref:chemotaxis protein CheB n=1 Tax=Pseudomonas sp. v388 TaxID=2479849 RepID=UPI000F77DAF1|nr:chemotaxis protein CheB [Pseudomonas sp. v388]RRV10565.1 chemotaxis protein CheB [Pseudomonas sp. v388]